MQIIYLITLVFLTMCRAAYAEPLKVVASFSVLGDLVTQVGGADVDVTTLVGPDADTHVYEPGPADVRAIAHASLLVVNGLGLEGWMDRLAKAADYRRPVIVATKGVTPLSSLEGPDPHAWQSIPNAETYVKNIRDGLEAADPLHAGAYDQRAAAYLATLKTLDGQVRARFQDIPESRRVVVTTHDAFAYFGDAYGIVFMAPEGLSTDGSPSAAMVGKLISRIRKDNLKAVFIENMSDHRIIDRIVSDTGVDVSGILFSDALSPPYGPASTYFDMMDYNSGMISKAMRRN